MLHNTFRAVSKLASGVIYIIPQLKGRTDEEINADIEALFASVDTLPKGQDAKQGLAGTESGAVDAEGSETPNLQHPHQDTSGVSNHG
jgi:hypothetical protein